MTKQEIPTFCIKIDDSNSLTFNLGHFDQIEGKNSLFDLSENTFQDTESIRDHDVPHLVEPHLIFDLKQSVKNEQNLILVRIVDFIQNENTISQIAELSKTAIKHVREAIKHLIYYQIVIMCPKFKFDNRY